MTAPVPPAPSGPASNATLAEVGLQATYLDRSVDPCVDFVQFACGGWLATTQIPADQQAWSTASEAAEKNRAALKTLLEQAPGKLGDFYASCMDEAAIEKAGVTPLKSLLDKTTKVKDAKSWLGALVELHKVGVPAVFRPSTEPVGMPPKAIVLLGGSSIQADAKDVARMLGLAGVAKPEVAAADAIAIANELAKLDGPEQVVDQKALAKRTASIDWNAYFKGLGLTPAAKLPIRAPRVLEGLDALRKRFKPQRWSGYFTYQLLAATASALPKAFAETSENPPRFGRCIAITAETLPDLLGQTYVAKYFSAQARQNAPMVIDALLAALHDDLAALDWMTDATRQRTLEWLRQLVRVVGFAGEWRSYDVDVKRDDFAGNLLRARAADIRNALLVGRQVVRGPRMSVAHGVPTYIPGDGVDVPDVFNVPAAFLQPPFFAEQRSIAANAGGVSLAVGGELVRGLREHLTADDRAKYDTKAECVAQQYGTFEAAPKQYIDGKRTLESNVADLAGVKLAFRAYRSLRKGAAQPIVADGFTEDQQFFLGVAQAACSKARPAELQRMLTSSAEAPPKFRVYGALRNLPEFAQAFSCAAGTPMHPAQTCSVW